MVGGVELRRHRRFLTSQVCPPSALFYARSRRRKGSSGGQLSRTGILVVPMPRLTYAGPMVVCGYHPATNRGPAPFGTYGGRKGSESDPRAYAPRGRAQRTPLARVANQRPRGHGKGESGPASPVAPAGQYADEGAWRRVARARAQVPRSAARRVPVSGWSAQSPAAGGRQRGV